LGYLIKTITKAIKGETAKTASMTRKLVKCKMYIVMMMKHSLRTAGNDAIILVNEYSFNPLKNPVKSVRMLSEIKGIVKATNKEVHKFIGRFKKPNTRSRNINTNIVTDKDVINEYDKENPKYSFPSFE